MVFYIIVIPISAGLNLIPDTFLYFRIIFRVHQIAEFTIGELHEIIQVVTPREVDHLPIGEQNAFVCFVCFVDEKGTGQVAGDIIQFKSKLCPLGSVEATLVAETTAFSSKFYLIECHIRITQQIRKLLCMGRVLGIAYGNTVVMRLAFALKGS